MSRQRDYQTLAKHVGSRTFDSQEQRLRWMIDCLWDSLHSTGVSWVGVYLDEPESQDDRRLVLGPCRDKPACSPIGLHGLCGQALLARQARFVRDVKDLGANYIACDPRDQSEVVIPLLGEDGRCWGVLDLDSWTIAAFDEHDVAGLQQVIRAAGLGP